MGCLWVGGYDDFNALGATIKLNDKFLQNRRWGWQHKDWFRMKTLTAQLSRSPPAAAWAAVVIDKWISGW